MSHIETTYHQLSIDSNGHVSVRKEVTFNNELEEVIATARDKEYFAKDADVSALPEHFQDAITSFWAGLPEEESPVDEEE
jgi:hypothetical protein